MNYIVLDLEWNQASYKGEEEAAIPFEIIEIGATKLNEKREIIGEFQKLIRPQVYPFLLRRTKEITGWTDRDLEEQGIYFEDACAEFLKWCGKDYIFCLWGSGDLTQFERNMSYYKIKIPWKYPFRYLDIQKLYALQNKEGKVRRMLEIAVEQYNLTEDRPYHHAADDAYYTARVFQKIDLEKYGPYFSTDYYQVPRNRFEEQTFTFPTYTKFVSRLFNLKEEVIANRRVREFRCRICGKTIRPKINWFTDGRSYMCYGMCKEHGPMRGRIRIKMGEKCEGYFAVRTVKTCTEEDYEIIAGKKQAIRDKRKEKRVNAKRKARAKQQENRKAEVKR